MHAGPRPLLLEPPVHDVVAAQQSARTGSVLIMALVLGRWAPRCRSQGGRRRHRIRSCARAEHGRQPWEVSPSPGVGPRQSAVRAVPASSSRLQATLREQPTQQTAARPPGCCRLFSLAVLVHTPSRNHARKGGIRLNAELVAGRANLDDGGTDVPGPQSSEPRCRTVAQALNCLLYTSPSPRDGLLSRMPSSA